MSESKARMRAERDAAVKRVQDLMRAIREIDSMDSLLFVTDIDGTRLRRLLEDEIGRRIREELERNS